MGGLIGELTSGVITISLLSNRLLGLVNKIANKIAKMNIVLYPESLYLIEYCILKKFFNLCIHPGRFISPNGLFPSRGDNRTSLTLIKMRILSEPFETGH